MDTKNLKIALVSQEYPPETARGGIGSQTFAKANGLAELGHEVFVISRSVDFNRYEETIGRVIVIRIPGMENRLTYMTETVQWLTHSMVIAEEIEALHSRVQLDIIDFPEWAAEGYTFFLNRTEWNYIPAVIQLHGPLVMFANVMNWPAKDSLFYKVGTHMEATCIQLADAVYSSSQCSAEWVTKYYSPKTQNIPTMHMGVDTTFFAPQCIKKNNYPTIIFVGKLVRNKGIIELIDAAINLLEDFPELRLRIVGGGEDSLIAQLKKQADDAGALNLLDFAGYKQKEELPAELSKAHLFALPSYYEGGPGFVFLEAMACGLPVIGCTGSGVEEIVTEDTGILVPPKDFKSLATAIKKILVDKVLFDRVGENARQYVVNHADSKDCIKKVEAFYLEVVEKYNKVQVENSLMIMT